MEFNKAYNRVEFLSFLRTSFLPEDFQQETSVVDNPIQFQYTQQVTHKDVRLAFDWTLSPHRVSSLLKRLVSEGRLIRIGDGCQTRYRAAYGHFGR